MGKSSPFSLLRPICISPPEGQDSLWGECLGLSFWGSLDASPGLPRRSLGDSMVLGGEGAGQPSESLVGLSEAGLGRGRPWGAGGVLGCPQAWGAQEGPREAASFPLNKMKWNRHRWQLSYWDSPRQNQN